MVIKVVKANMKFENPLNINAKLPKRDLKILAPENMTVETD